MQPQLVFVGAEQAFERRGGEHIEPLAHSFRQALGFLLRHRAQPATEPLLRQAERNRLQLPQFRRMKPPPPAPEFLIVGMVLQKPGQLVDMIRTHAAAQQVAQQVQTGIAQSIRRIQSPSAPPRPKIVQPWRAQPLRALVPQAEMQLDRKGTIGIEVIAAPAPSGFADQGGQMIRRQSGSRQRLVAFLEEQLPRTPYVFIRAQQVQVVQHPQARVRNKMGPLCSAFQKDEIDAGRG